MNAMKSSASLLVVGLVFSGLGGCYYDEPPRRLAPEAQPYPSNPAPPESGGAEGTPAPSSPSPMLVEVDADQTMDAVGGDGVGVFIEYAKGGHWHVWWTCDTTETRQSCDFSVSAAAASGNIENLDASELAGATATSPTASRVEATTTTTTEVHGIRFDTNPGAVITVDAAVGGLKDGAFLFFVQDGKVNGGFKGKVTNPLQLQGNAP